MPGTAAIRVAFALAVLFVAAPRAGEAGAEAPAINYISADAVYVNVGSRAGLEAGARIEVRRGGSTVGELVVVHVSSHSASCRIVSQTRALQVGDLVFFEAVERAPEQTEARSPEPTTKPAPPPPGRRVRGSITIQSVWQRDLDPSGLSSVQPGIGVRLAVADPFGAGGTLRIRHRSRFYHRARPLSTELDTDEWAHRLSEFGWYLDTGGVRDAVAFGRVINPFMRGLGYLDGGYATMRAGDHYRLGVAAGLDPRIEDSSMQPGHRKYGLFVAYERGERATRRLGVTLAFSGSYDGGVIDREFGYVQTTFTAARRLSLYHSMEIDMNRGWRRDREGSAVSFSNTYAGAHAIVNSFLALDASYDARRNIRDIRVYDSPDSLFDDALSTGYSAGVTVSLPRHIRLRARAGERFRETDDYRNRHASFSLSAAHFPVRGHGMTARVSISDTPFVTGYRPALSWRFPVTRRTRLTLGGGAYVYHQRIRTTTSGFAEAGIIHTFGARYFASGQVRRIGGEGLDAVTATAEIGLSL